MLGMDILEKLRIVQNECENLLCNMQHVKESFHFEDEQQNTLKKSYAGWNFADNKLQNKLFIMLAIQDVSSKAKLLFTSFSEEFAIYCNKLNYNEGKESYETKKDDSFYKFIAARDKVTNLLETYTKILKSNQFILLIEREHTMSTLPHQSILRRFNQSTYSDFLTKYSKIQKYIITTLVERSILDKSIVEEFSSTYITQLWGHQVTSRVNNLEVLRESKQNESKKGKCKKKKGSFLTVENAYWFVDLPIYITLINHELAHHLLNLIQSSDSHESGVIKTTYIELKAAIAMCIMKQTSRIDSGVTDIAEEYVNEIIADVIAILSGGEAYLAALLMQLSGVGLNMMFHGVEEEDMFGLDAAFSTLPDGAIMLWYIRLKVANEICKAQYKASDDNFNGDFYDGVDQFFSTFCASGKHFYRYSKNLSIKFQKTIIVADELSSICVKYLKKSFLKKYSYDYKALAVVQKPIVIDEYFNDHICELMKNYRKNVYLEDCTCRDETIKKDCSAKWAECKNGSKGYLLDDLKFKFIHSVPWKSVFNLAQFVTGECNRFEQEIATHFDTYPSGKRSFMLALENYFFKFGLSNGYVVAHEYFESKMNINKGEDVYKKLSKYMDSVTNNTFWKGHKSFSESQTASFKNILDIVNKDIISLDEKEKESFIKHIRYNMGFTIEPGSGTYSFKAEDFLKDILKCLVSDSQGLTMCTMSFCKINKYLGETKDMEFIINDIVDEHLIYKKLYVAKKIVQKVQNDQLCNEIMEVNPEFRNGVSALAKKINITIQNIEDQRYTDCKKLGYEFTNIAKNIKGILCGKEGESESKCQDREEYSNFKKALNNIDLSYLSGALFSPYHFFILHEGYFPNVPLEISSRTNKYMAFRANNKLMLKFNFKKYFEKSMSTVSEKSIGCESAIIRLELRYKGAICLLLNEIRDASQEEREEKWPFSICDEVYWSSGWEDVVFFLKCKSSKAISIIKESLFSHPMKNGMRTYPIREFNKSYMISSLVDKVNYLKSKKDEFNKQREDELSKQQKECLKKEIEMYEKFIEKLDVHFDGLKSLISDVGEEGLRKRVCEIVEKAINESCGKNYPAGPDKNIAVMEAYTAAKPFMIKTAFIFNYISHFKTKFVAGWNYSVLEEWLKTFVEKQRICCSDLQVELMSFMGRVDYQIRWHGVQDSNTMNRILKQFEKEQYYKYIHDMYTTIIDQDIKEQKL